VRHAFECKLSTCKRPACARQVTLEEVAPDGRQSHVRLTVTGLAENGFLLATDDSGQQFELHPDGNSLDFFRGLIRRKAAECTG
jgi:biotin---protein ligase